MNTHTTLRPWVRWGCLAVIFAVGLAFRLINYSEVQPQNPDEAMYLRQARFMATLGRLAVKAPVPVIDADAFGIWRYVRKSDWYSKPCWLHAGFMAIPMMFFGCTAAAGLSVNLAFSLAAVVLVYLIGRRLFDEISGLGGAGLISISHYWLVYSRSFYAEVDAVCLVLLAFYLIVRVKDVDRVAWLSLGLAGVATALACLCHYRLLFVMAPLGLSILILARRWRAAVIRGTVFVGSFCVVLLSVEVGLSVVARAAGPSVPFTGLLGALAEQYIPDATGKASQTGWQPMNMVDYARHIARWQGGAAFCLLILGGGMMACGRKRREGAAVLAAIAVPLIVLTLQIWVVARAASILLPFTCIVVGHGVSCLFGYVQRKELVAVRLVVLALTVCLCAVSVTESAVRNAALVRNVTGYEATAIWLVENGISEVYASTPTGNILGWYVPTVGVVPIRDLVADPAGSQVSIALFDAMIYHYYPESRRPFDELERRISAIASRTWSTGNMTATWTHFLYDGTQAHSVDGMQSDMREVRQKRIASIRVYGCRSLSGNANNIESHSEATHLQADHF